VSIKDVRNQGIFPVQTFYGQGDSYDADVRIFGAKTSDFLKFMMCPHKQGG